MKMSSVCLMQKTERTRNKKLNEKSETMKSDVNGYFPKPEQVFVIKKVEHFHFDSKPTDAINFTT